MTNRLLLTLRATSDTTSELIETEFNDFTTHKVLEAMDTEPEQRKKWMLEKIQCTPGFFHAARPPKLWEEPADRKVVDTRRSSSMAELLENIHQTPVRERIVEISQDYLYSSAKDYTGTVGLVNITKIPQVEQQLAALDNMKGVFSVKYVRN